MKCYECNKEPTEKETAFTLCKECERKMNTPVKVKFAIIIILMSIGTGLVLFTEYTISFLFGIPIGAMIILTIPKSKKEKR